MKVDLIWCVQLPPAEAADATAFGFPEKPTGIKSAADFNKCTVFHSCRVCQVILDHRGNEDPQDQL